ncbi:hypothetical protein [Rhizobium ruizarguesonis]|uniref:hypothetical protein n=1 Tax=Rhizobium ruizarguesonis TaxID=2081791 RepID=UPI0018D5A4D7|nr:hypothetical protein [Rhizobium ruizarguesonis]
MIDVEAARSTALIVATITMATPITIIAHGKARACHGVPMVGNDRQKHRHCADDDWRDGSAVELNGEGTTDKVSHITRATKKQADQEPGPRYSNGPESPIGHEEHAGETEDAIAGDGQIPRRERRNGPRSDEGQSP